MTLFASDVLRGESSRVALERTIAVYEERAGQLDMARAVELALADDSPLFVEAGTGTGKTLAYLVPAVLSGKKVIISTATRALEEQIFTKDIPLVRELLEPHGVTFRAALMKGMGNYACRRRLEEAATSASGARYRRLAQWAETSETGDRAELSDLGDNDELWTDVQSSSETRIGSTCAHYGKCFITSMRRKAEDAEIVVVNHHLFFADLALRRAREGYASALPNYDAVIFDEAHQIEDIATDFFGVRITSGRFEAWVRDARRANVTSRTVSDAERTASLLFARLAKKARMGERRLLAPSDWDEGDRAAALDVQSYLRSFVHEIRDSARNDDSDEGHEPAREVLARRADDMARDLAEIAPAEQAPTPFDDAPAEVRVRENSRITWLEVKERSLAFGASPVELGPTLRQALFDRVPGVICTSATLASTSGGQPSFHFARARLGAPPHTRELVVESPFDYATRAALYVTRELPDPASPGFDAALGERALELIALTKGGAFVLCTSVRSMKAVHARLEKRVPGPLLVQGALPKHLLLSKFRAAGNATLVATMSFWEGVDVPGHALRLVILDKIPFAVPSDPLVMARSARIEAEGGNPFAEYSIPAAALTLKQGFGRLLRSASDYGVVAILDPRMVTRGYGKKLLAGLPPARVVTTMEELRAFWSSLVPEPEKPGDAPDALSC